MDTIFFSNAYNNDLFKALGIITSLLNFFVLTPFLHAIIWYEQFGSDHPRSLINQLVASTCWNGIVHNLLYIPLLIFIDAFGPMSHSFCGFNFVLKNTIIIHLILMILFIIFAKYLSIFVLKNPTEVCSDFWCFYLNILSLVLSLVSQTVFIVFPGKNPIDFNICTGTNPMKFNTAGKKFNFFHHVSAGVCITLFIIVCLRVKIFARNSVNPFGKPTAEQGWNLPPITEFLEKNSMASFGTIGMMILSLLPYWFINLATLAIIPPEVLSSHPYQIIIHFHHHGLRFVCNLLLLLAFFSRSSTRRSVFREIMELKSGFQEMIGLN